MNFQRKKMILIAIAVLALALLTVGVSKIKHSMLSKMPHSTESREGINPLLLTNLQTDLQGIAPYGIDTDDLASHALSAKEERIKNDVVNILIATSPEDREYHSRLLLRSVGTRYVLVAQPSASSYYDILVDSQTGKISSLEDGASYVPQRVEGMKMILYIGYKDIYTYTLDESAFVLLPGSILSDSETYHSGRGDFRLLPEETHTSESIHISVFDASQSVQDPDALSEPNALQTMNRKVREVTLPLP